MKRWIASFGLLVLLLPLAVSYGQTPTAWGRFTWKYDTAGRDGIPGNADDDPFCTATAPTGCVSGFRHFYLDRAGVEHIGIQFVPVSTCTLDAGSTSTYSCAADAPTSATGAERYDKFTWYAKAVMKDSAGAEILTDMSNTAEVQRKARPLAALAVS